MSHVMDMALIFSIVFMVIWAAITSSINTAFADAWEGVTCPLPDWNEGIDEACTSVNHPDPYSEDEIVLFNIPGGFYSGGNNITASIPTGWGSFVIDTIGVVGTKIGSFFTAIVAIFIMPELTLYDQTVSATDIGWLSGGLFAFAIFGLINQFKGFI